MKNTLKWKKAGTIYPTDHIISSTAREVGYSGFIPEYENVKNVSMRFIMSNEYMRLWFTERDLYIKENYSKAERARTETTLRRRFVQRMMTNPKAQSRELPIIQLKRFQNIISKVDNRRTEGEKAEICKRYKQTVAPIELERFKPSCPIAKKDNVVANAKSPVEKEKVEKTKTSTEKPAAEEKTPQKEAPEPQPHHHHHIYHQLQHKPLGRALRCQLCCKLG